MVGDLLTICLSFLFTFLVKILSFSPEEEERWRKGFSKLQMRWTLGAT